MNLKAVLRFVMFIVVLLVSGGCQSINVSPEPDRVAQDVHIITSESTRTEPFIPSPSPAPTSPPEEQDIDKLLEQGKIEVNISGGGISIIQIQIRRLVNEDLLVRVPPGTYFASKTAGKQNMVATKSSNSLLGDSNWEWISVPAACANIDLEIPNSFDFFAIQPSPNNIELTQVLSSLPADQEIPYDVLQAIVWIITDNANYNDLGRLVVRNTTSVFSSRSINVEEALLAMRWIDQAGVDITRKAIWNEKDWLLMVIDDESLIAWIAQKRAELPQVERSILIGHTFRSYQFSPDGITLAVGGEDGLVELWDAQSGVKLNVLAGMDWSVNKLEFSAIGHLLAASAEDGQVIVWDVETQRVVFNHKDDYSTQAMALSPDGASLAVVTAAQIWIWDLPSKQVIDKFGDFADVEDLRFMPDGETIAVAMDAPVYGFESSVKFWSLKNKLLTQTISLFQTQIGLSMDISPDGRFLAYGAQKLNKDYVVFVMDLETGHKITLSGIYGIAEVKFSPDSQTLATATGSYIKIWGVGSWEEIEQFEVEGYYSSLFVPMLGFTADGKYLAVGRDQEILLYGH